MKKILAVFLGIVAFAIVYAASPSGTDLAFESKVDTSVTTIDTLVGVDSQTIVSAWYPDERGWSYYLINKECGGTGSDSVHMYIWGGSYNSSGTLLNKQLIDSVTTLYPKAIKIPINLTMTGATYTLKAIGVSGLNGSQVITNGWQLVKYRPMNWNK